MRRAPVFHERIRPSASSRKIAYSETASISSASCSGVAPLGGVVWRGSIRASSLSLCFGDGAERAPVRGQRDVDVAAGGVRVRADLVGELDELGRLVRVVDRGQRDVELDGELEG